MRKTIVIGTFDYHVYEQLCAKLKSYDYEVRLAQRGEKVLLELLNNDIDLLILDLDLAGVMGVNILPVIRRLKPRLPLILITDDVNEDLQNMPGTFQAFKPMTNAETDAIAIATTRLMNRQIYDVAAL